MELCKHVETKFVPSGAILFRPGQIDDSIYVVKNGLLKVYIIERVCLHVASLQLLIVSLLIHYSPLTKSYACTSIHNGILLHVRVYIFVTEEQSRLLERPD